MSPLFKKTHGRKLLNVILNQRKESNDSYVNDEQDSEAEMNLALLKRDTSFQTKQVKKVENRYLDSLMYKTEKSSFLLKDVKEIFKPKNVD